MKLCDGTFSFTASRILMLAVKATVIALVLLAATFLTGQTKNKGNIIFQDYFTDGNDAGWTRINRAWGVTKGRYLLSTNYLPDAIGRGGWSLTHKADKTWRDYTLQATFDITNAPGLPSPDVHTALFLVRVKSFAQPGVDVGLPSGGTYYSVEVWPRGTSDPRTGCSECVIPGGLVGFTKQLNGEQVITIFKEYSNAVVGTNAITIRVAGKRIQVWINGQYILSYTDPNPIRYGGIGLGATWEAQAWFDNVVVSRVSGRR